MSQVTCNKRGKYQNISRDRRELLIKAVMNEGIFISEAAKRYDIKPTTARTIIQKFNKDGKYDKQERGGPQKTKMNTEMIQFLENLVEENNQFTLVDYQDRLLMKYGVLVCISTIHKSLFKLKITLKKASKKLLSVNTERSIQLRYDFAIDFTQNAPQNKRNCIYLDESGFNSHLRKGTARSKKGVKAVVTVPAVRGRMVSLILAMNNEKVLHYKIVSDSTCDGKVFADFIGELFAVLDTDATFSESWILMDNAMIHRVQAVQDLFENTSYIRKPLSPYSFMLNPCENVFSKVKAIARSILSTNSENPLTSAIQFGVNAISGTDCANYFIHTCNNLAKALTKQTFP